MDQSANESINQPM